MKRLVPVFLFCTVFLCLSLKDADAQVPSVGPTSHSVDEKTWIPGDYVPRNRSSDSAQPERATRVPTGAERLYEQGRVTYNAGIDLYNAGRYRDAVEHFRRATQLRTEARDYQWLCHALIQLKFYGEAEAAIREAIRLGGDVADYTHLAAVLSYQNRYGEALDAMRRGARLNANDSFLRENLPHYVNSAACELLRHNQPKEAERLFREASQLQAKNVIFIRNLGIVLERQGRLAEAETAFREALKLDPKNPRAHFELGTLSGRQERYADAEKMFLAALLLNPKYPDAHRWLSSAQWWQKRFTDAEQSSRKAIELNPNDAAAHNLLGASLAGQDKDSEAAYREAIRLDPNEPRYKGNLANTLGQKGYVLFNSERDFAKAEAVLREAIQLLPQSARAHNNLGAVLTELGRYDEADAELRRALQLDPNYENPQIGLKQNQVRREQAAAEPEMRRVVEQLRDAVRKDDQSKTGDDTSGGLTLMRQSGDVKLEPLPEGNKDVRTGTPVIPNQLGQTGTDTKPQNQLGSVVGHGNTARQLTKEPSKGESDQGFDTAGRPNQDAVVVMPNLKGLPGEPIVPPEKRTSPIKELERQRDQVKAKRQQFEKELAELEKAPQKDTVAIEAKVQAVSKTRNEEHYLNFRITEILEKAPEIKPSKKPANEKAKPK